MPSLRATDLSHTVDAAIPAAIPAMVVTAQTGT
jgi:hypothetical protein